MDTSTEIASIGHNNPPGPIDHAMEAMVELRTFLADNPVIQTPAQAKEGAAYIERTRIALGEMETERTSRVGPLNAEVAEINSTYRGIREPLEKVLKELRARLTKFAAEEEAKRIAEANRLAAERAEAERIAREAEAREQEAIAGAAVGEVVDVGGFIVEADSAFSQFQKADRAAVIAERDVSVRISSMMGGRAISMRTTEILVVDDAAKAIKAIGLTEKIRDAILSSARDYRKLKGELPKGISATHERKI